MSETPPEARLILRIVVLAIIVWGLYLIVGAFLRRPSTAAVLAGCFLGFLGFWWAAFKMRSRRLARQAEAEALANDPASPNHE